MIKLLVLDVDGTLTNGQLTFDSNGIKADPLDGNISLVKLGLPSDYIKDETKSQMLVLKSKNGTEYVNISFKSGSTCAVIVQYNDGLVKTVQLAGNQQSVELEVD